jgi:alpha-mannosidase
MLVEERNTVEQIERFLKDKAFFYYEKRISFAALLVVDENPIPFGSLQKYDWKEIQIGEVWGHRFQSAWFRFRAGIPQRWKGKEVVAVIDTGSEACVFDRQGTPVCGLTSKAGVTDPFYRKALIPICTRAEGGEEIELLVEAAANSTMGIQNEARLNDCSLALFRRDLWHLYHDIFFLFDLATHIPQADTRRPQIFSSLHEALYLFRDGSEENVELSRRALKASLEKEAAVSSQEISVLGHAHLDVVWLWPLRETIRKAGRTFSSALYYMGEYPEYRFGASQPQLYQLVKERYPRLFSRIKQAVKEGQWEPLGAMWVEPDCNLCGGESLVRQILYGKRFFSDEFGVEVDNLWLPDTFGFTPALPQLMRKSGLRYFMSQKLSWNKNNRFPYHTFIWEGLDGSRVFTHFLPMDTMNSTLHPKELIYGMNNFQQKDRCRKWLCLYGEGDGGGGPGRHHLELARRAKSCEGLFSIYQEFAREFFSKAEQEAQEFPEWRGELYLETHRGTLTTCGKTKWYNRRAEVVLHTLEFLLLVNCSLYNQEYPTERLEALWKKLLLNQFHDILPGTTIPMAFQESSRQFEELLEEAQAATQKALKGLIQGCHGSQGKSRILLLCNPTGFAREQVYLLSLKDWKDNESLVSNSGQALPVQKTKEGVFISCKLPAYGFALVSRNEATKAAFNTGILQASKESLENEKIRIEFSDDGFLRRILDKEEAREVVAEESKANRFLLFRDTPKEYDAWDIDPDYRAFSVEESRLLSVEVQEQGCLCASIIQKRTVCHSEISQEIRLYKDSKLIEFKTRVDWQERQKMLKVAFPLNIHSECAYYDIQFGNLQRSVHRNTSWEAAQFEVFAHKWVDLSEYGYGVALLNDCKYGHSVYKNTLELTLLRSPIDPDPERDRGVHRFTYALLPHCGDFREGKVVPAGYFLNIPVVYLESTKAIRTQNSPRILAGKSFFAVDRSNVVVETIKRAEKEKAAIVRLYEAFGMRTPVCLRTPFKIQRATETDLLENDIQELSVRKGRGESCLQFYIRPYEIKTLKLWIAEFFISETSQRK